MAVSGGGILKNKNMQRKDDDLNEQFCTMKKDDLVS